MNTQDNEGKTPLTWAAQNGHKVMVKLLLEASADDETVDCEGRSALWRVTQNDHERIERMLSRMQSACQQSTSAGTTIKPTSLTGLDNVIA